jgi:hypothetical protein
LHRAGDPVQEIAPTSMIGRAWRWHSKTKKRHAKVKPRNSRIEAIQTP